jgi:tetratricopeptide (TPR) repeat protein
MLYSLPALLMAATAGGLAAASWLTADSQLIRRYLSEGDRAMRDQDYASARTCFRKALALGDARPAVRYDLALCLDALGQHTGSQALLKPLTDPGQTGYVPARLYRARQLMNQGSPAAFQDALLQLQRVVQQEPDQIDGQVLIGQLYMNRGRYDEAEPHLLKAAVARPALRLMLARLYLARGEKDHAHQQAREAWDYYRRGAEAGDEVALLACEEAARCLEAYPEAAMVLRKGLDIRDSPAVRLALGRIYTAWVQSLGQGLQASPLQQLELLQQGLRYCPADLGLLQCLLNMTKRTGTEADKARSLLNAALAEGVPSAITHLLLG